MALSLLPMASLSLLNGTHGVKSRTSLSVSRAAAPSRSPPLLQSSLISSPSTSLSFHSSFSGISLGINLSSNIVVRERYRSLQVTAAGKQLLCMTKRNRSRKSLARTHGFRRRMQTTSGRAVLKRRRAKGRHILCTKSNPNSGKRGG